MIIGVILAAGKGSRFKAKGVNKTSVVFKNKPLIQYGLDIYSRIANKSYIIVGAFSDSVKEAVGKKYSVTYVKQAKRLGTGHAVKILVEALKKQKEQPTTILIGNGDHMTFYSATILKNAVASHVINKNVITFITTDQEDPKGLGRVVRNEKGDVLRIVEEKDASAKEKKITEINAGFYCFSYEFLLKNYKKLSKSPASGEYYITELIDIAVRNGQRIHGFNVPFKYVGFGINTQEDYANGLLLYSSR